MTTDCLGVDGAKAGWVAAFRDGPGLGWALYPDARTLVEENRSARVIAVDIPIGLPDRDGREADTLARRFVGGKRASSVFSVPVRGILDAQTRAEASTLHRTIDGRGFGAQSFAILPKIRQWDALLQSDAMAREIVREVHPEVCFAALNGGHGNGAVASKHTAQGLAERLALLVGQFGDAPVRLLLGAVPRRSAKADDVMDALVALWTAERIAAGMACSLPSPVVPDATGLPACIWY